MTTMSKRPEEEQEEKRFPPLPDRQRQPVGMPGEASGSIGADVTTTGEIPGVAAQPVRAREAIGEAEIRQAYDTLQRYRTGKKALEQRVIDNEQWYKLRHWENLRKATDSGVEPSSGWLFNALANKHADAMDNIPAPNVLPREEGDKAEAEMLSSIIPVVLDQNDFEGTFSAVMDDKLKGGTGIYGVFWDADKLNGLGDISIRCVDIVNLFWEPGIRDIQASRNVFHVELMDNDLLSELYPQAKDRLGSGTGTVAEYIHDDTIDTSEKSAVIDWYYHKNGKLHYCKFVEGVVLFATENEAEYQDGWYADGQYPFVLDPLFAVKGSPCGFGYIDVAKSAQEYIDRGNQAILMNMLANARPRHFIRNDGSVNEKEYGDYTKDFIHVEGGNLGTDSIMPVPQNPLTGNYITIIQDKINELKEVTGNRDMSTGGTTGGVTAASAIAAMQEAGSKLSRDNNKGSYRAFRAVVLMVIERIRQFYTLPRCFRIMGQSGQERYIEYTNQGIAEQVDESGDLRLPLFDVEISAEKQSAYSKMSNNELALQFYSAGFFNPQMADQALACLDMMDFNRKSFIENKIRENGSMYQMMQMMQQQMLGMAQQLDGMQGSNLTEQMMMQFGMTQPGIGAPATAAGQEALGDEGGKLGESSTTKNARKRVADSTDPQ